MIDVAAVNTEIVKFALLDDLHRIQSLAKMVEGSGPSVVLDISSLPKRFFFPLLSFLARSATLHDLVVTYTSPNGYPTNDVLSEDCDGWVHLPGFPPTADRTELLIVGIGFMAESLQQHLSSIIEHESIKVLIPFPAPIAAVRRAWEAVFHIESLRSEQKFSNHRVDAVDISAAFDRIVSLAKNKASPAFAPFGPKPISAAMCLFSTQYASAVYYPQPKAYNPDYSEGVAIRNGKPLVHAYWIKHAGVNFYTA